MEFEELETRMEAKRIEVQEKLLPRGEMVIPFQVAPVKILPKIESCAYDVVKKEESIKDASLTVNLESSELSIGSHPEPSIDV